MIRSGIGFDAHQLKKGTDLYIGGVKIDSDLGSLGHSDGDALIHALADSLLGAAGMGDIGQYFPSEEKEWKNAKSEIFLFEVKKILIENGQPVDPEFLQNMQLTKLDDEGQVVKDEEGNPVRMPKVVINNEEEE